MEICPLTNQKVNIQMPNPEQLMFFYETPMTGKIKITDIALASAGSLNSDEKQILVGICRNMTIKGEQPMLIDYAFFKQLKNQSIPYSFEARANHLLKYLYENGGKEYKSHNLNSERDSPITYSSRDEFERIVEYLLDNGLIDCGNIERTKQCNFYSGLKINKQGIAKVEDKSKPEQIDLNNEELNKLIDDLEMGLRKTVVATLIRETGKDDFEILIRGDAKQQIRRRIELHLMKHLNQTKDDFKSLTKAVQFFDIDHLKKVILKNEYWDFFEPKFRDKIKVERYFDHFGELRHTVKHQRNITPLVLLEGKAAIEWLRMAIN